MTHIFYGLFKLIRVFLEGKPINLSHFFISIFFPLIVWQYIYDFSSSALNSNNIHPFVLSIALLLSMGCLASMAFILFPAEMEYTFKDEKFKRFLGDNRRLFYFVFFIYMVSTECELHLTGEYKLLPTSVFWLRIFIMILALIPAFLEIKAISNNEYVVVFRYFKIKGNKKTVGLDFIKSTEQCGQIKVGRKVKWLGKLNHYNLDSIITCAVLILFIVLLTIRNIATKDVKPVGKYYEPSIAYIDENILVKLDSVYKSIEEFHKLENEINLLGESMSTAEKIGKEKMLETYKAIHGKLSQQEAIKQKITLYFKHLKFQTVKLEELSRLESLLHKGNTPEVLKIIKEIKEKASSSNRSGSN